MLDWYISYIMYHNPPPYSSKFLLNPMNSRMVLQRFILLLETEAQNLTQIKIAKLNLEFGLTHHLQHFQRNAIEVKHYYLLA